MRVSIKKLTMLALVTSLMLGGMLATTQSTSEAATRYTHVVKITKQKKKYYHVKNASGNIYKFSGKHIKKHVTLKKVYKVKKFNKTTLSSKKRVVLMNKKGLKTTYYLIKKGKKSLGYVAKNKLSNGKYNAWKKPTGATPQLSALLADDSKVPYAEKIKITNKLLTPDQFGDIPYMHLTQKQMESMQTGKMLFNGIRRASFHDNNIPTLDLNAVQSTATPFYVNSSKIYTTVINKTGHWYTQAQARLKSFSTVQYGMGGVSDGAGTDYDFTGSSSKSNFYNQVGSSNNFQLVEGTKIKDCAYTFEIGTPGNITTKRNVYIYSITGKARFVTPDGHTAIYYYATIPGNTGVNRTGVEILTSGWLPASDIQVSTFS
ncbi:hypothetical protein EQG49_13430 [Periweissella cryptocerci]|uniref:Uncharacterized protein n=1 Tax=Periweissella cryptocerci TaxID=2506420 RepID=A0A4P6YWW0_9LACO|nr:hypothetical protein [Periweissella cryptocerci]QBO37399.1 hypothetical protein EQG49_13430 [Periweissella cryptocerci]